MLVAVTMHVITACCNIKTTKNQRCIADSANTTERIELCDSFCLFTYLKLLKIPGRPAGNEVFHHYIGKRPTPICFAVLTQDVQVNKGHQKEHHERGQKRILKFAKHICPTE